MPDTFVRTRCSGCGQALGFDDWSNGSNRCGACSQGIRKRKNAANYVAGPAMAPASAYASEAAAYERMLDDIPDELVDELVAALEAEAARRANEPMSPVRDVLEELSMGSSPRERPWAAWGFAAGFALNVVLAKWAQMSTGGSFADFIAPTLIGGVLAGATCAAIGWGLARLREPSPLRF